jgi:hypothetical protein
MIGSEEDIDKVVLGADGDEYFFVFKNKYVWSVASRESGFSLYFYPQALPQEIRGLASRGPGDWDQIVMVHYFDGDVGAGASNAFKRLFDLVKDKSYGMDKVLDDIIGDFEQPSF